MPLVDTHCHLSFAPLCDRLDAVLAAARLVDVTTVVVPAYDVPSWPKVLACTQQPGVFAALGIHPWVASQPYSSAELGDLLKSPKVVAIGEIGLDFQIEHADRERQIAVLQQQLDLAAERNLPVLLHCRGAFDELHDILSRYRPRLQGILHAFSRSRELAGRFLDLGLHLGLGGAITRPHASRARQTAAFVPLDRIVLETDAPSIGLEGIAPERVEPRHVHDVAQVLAMLRQSASDVIAAATTTNARRLLRLEPGCAASHPSLP